MQRVKGRGGEQTDYFCSHSNRRGEANSVSFFNRPKAALLLCGLTPAMNCL